MGASRGEWVRRIFTTDFCPWVNPVVAWFKHPVACLVMAAGVALVFAWLLKPIAWVVLGGLIFVLGLGWVWPWLAIRGIKAEVQFAEEPVTEGQTTRLAVVLTNRWPWPVWGLVLDELFPVAGAMCEAQDSARTSPSTQIALARVSAWSTSRFYWTIAPDCRGIYPQQPLTIATGFPFGLWMCRREVTVRKALCVWPKTFSVETLWDAPEPRPSEERFSEHLTGEFGDMTGTRPFREGDSLRRVHWAQTARNDRLIVCERQASVLSNVELIADVSPDVHTGPGPNSSLEWTIRILASLAKAWHAEQARVTCRWGNRSFLLPPGPLGIRQLMDALTRIPPEGQASDTHDPTGAGLQILISTDRGFVHDSHAANHPNWRRIVLSAAGFANQDMAPKQPDFWEEKRDLYLKDSERVAEQFRHQWRGICHVG